MLYIVKLYVQNKITMKIEKATLHMGKFREFYSHTLLLMLVASVITAANSASFYAKAAQTTGDENGSISYGCGLYPSPIFITTIVLHCDPLHNELKAYSMNGTARLIYSSDSSIIIPSMIFAPDGRLFFTEKSTGAIRILNDGKIVETPFVKLPNVDSDGEKGMLGLTLDPRFEQNHFLYLYYTHVDEETNQSLNRVVRFTDKNGIGSDMTILLDRIPANASPGVHSGGALAFGPDEKLYITVGDNYEADSAQDPSILTGKILRINRDGTIPDDNPWLWDNKPSRTHNNEVLDENNFVGFLISDKKSKTFQAKIDSTVKKINATSVKITINNNPDDVALYRDYAEKNFDTLRAHDEKGRNWSQYCYLSFWMNGSNDDSLLGVKIRDSEWVDRNEEYLVRNNFTGWNFFSVPLKETYPTMNFSAVRGIEFVFHKGWNTSINLDAVYLSTSPDPMSETKGYSFTSPVYTIGHRNMFGIAFNNEGIGIVTENGPAFYDEINKIEKAGNYGWPFQQQNDSPPERSQSSIKPLRSYWNTIAPAQAIYYDGDKIPELKGKFIFAAFSTNMGNLYALQFDEDNREVVEEQVIRTNHTGYITTLAQSPDGSLYFGGSSIYSLEGVDISTKEQFLFPIVISGDLDISIFQPIEQEKTLFMNIRAQQVPSQMSIKIPKMLLGEIATVKQGNEEVDFTVDDSSPDYNVVNLELKSSKDLRIVGTTIIPEFPLSGIVMVLFAFGIILGAMLNKRNICQ